ncbi:MAG: response regulator [Bryobacterales bacterium]|nr:response regulator [Bryobacterales bacterium]
MSIAANLFPIHIYEGLDLWLGGVFLCIAILYANPLQGAFATVPVYLVTLYLSGHPYGMIGSAVLALLGTYARTAGARKLFLDLLLGLSVAAPVVILILHRYVGVADSLRFANLLKIPINSILNLSLALLIVETAGAAGWLPKSRESAPHPLRASLLAGFLAVSMVPLILVFLFQGRQFEQNLRREQEAKLRGAARTVSGVVGGHQRRHLDAVIGAASEVEGVGAGNRARLNRVLESWHGRFPGFLTMIVTDAEGVITAAHPPTLGGTAHVVSDRAYFREPRASGKPFVSHAFRGRGFGSDPIVAISAPYYAEGKFAGVVEGSLDLAVLGGSLMTVAEVRDAELVVLDESRVVAGTSGTGFTPLDDVGGSEIYGLIRERAAGSAPFRVSLRGTAYQAASHEAGAPGWVVCVLFPEAALTAGLHRYFTESTLLVTAIMLLSVIAASVLARQVTKPLDSLMRQVRRLRDEPAHYRGVVVEQDSGPEEIQILLGDFRDMTAKLQTTYSGLERSIEERDALNARLTNLLSELEERVRERTAEFENAKLRAEEASRTKSAFLANMSHEVRTPLNGVIGMLAMLLEHPLEDGQRKRALIALDSAESLLCILNDVLDLSKIEAGHLSIERLAFRAQEVIEAALQPFRTSAESKGLDFRVAVDAKSRGNFFGDPARLRQVLANLVGNAVKFTSAGSVTVSVQGLEIDDRSRAIHVRIRDTGIGIPREAQLRLFQPFQQADSTTTRRFGGTGLGLAICRELIQRMGGVIGFESTEGEGSTFWFRVVLDIAPETPATPSAARPATRMLHRGRVLIVEDNQVNQLVAERLVEKAGFTTTVVESGRLALLELEKTVFDAILMDCQMPDMDGYQTTAEIRRREKEKRTPIIAMTAHAMTGDRERCLEAGMDDYITKPVRESELHELLDHWTAAVPADT